MQYFRANPVCGQVLNPTLSEALYRGHQPPLHKATCKRRLSTVWQILKFLRE